MKLYIVTLSWILISRHDQVLSFSSKVYLLRLLVLFLNILLCISVLYRVRRLIYLQSQIVTKILKLRTYDGLKNKPKRVA
jgi:hypothetical protein